MKLLFITNGHGEDAIASRIIKELPHESISVMPLVGAGEAFNDLSVEIIGKRKKMPSGGFIYQSFSNIVKDIFSGLISNTIEQIKILRSLKNKFDLVIAIGDIVPIVGALFAKTRFIFIGCAKSSYYSYSYTPWEKYLLKKYCALCFPRDKKTTGNLIKHGIKAEYVGNPMMDCFTITGNGFGIEKDAFVVGILPGTRDDAYLNMEDTSLAAEELAGIAKNNNKKIEFLAASAPNSSAYGRLSQPAVSRMMLLKDRFGDILNAADVIIGLSGTGNEQAAGMGKPVISFPGRGVQYTASFAKRQKELLGEALYIVKNEPSLIAKEVWALLLDKNRRQRMAAAGRERMGLPGASAKIAAIIKEEGKKGEIRI